MKKKINVGKKTGGMKREYEKQTRLIIFLMLALILVIFLIYFLVQESKKFEYGGFKFTKGKQGNLVLYYSSMPLSDMNGRVVGYVPFYLREDPRELERMSIDGNIIVKKEVALSASPDFKCEDNSLALTTLSLNLGKLGIKTRGASTNETYAEENNMAYVNYDTCLNTNYTVLLFREDDQSRITRVAGNCYILDIANCEIMNVTERFMIGLYANIIGEKI